jgi:hypothetical protein
LTVAVSIVIALAKSLWIVQLMTWMPSTLQLGKPAITAACALAGATVRRTSASAAASTARREVKRLATTAP